MEEPFTKVNMQNENVGLFADTLVKLYPEFSITASSRIAAPLEHLLDHALQCNQL